MRLQEDDAIAQGVQDLECSPGLGMTGPGTTELSTIEMSGHRSRETGKVGETPAGEVMPIGMTSFKMPKGFREDTRITEEGTDVATRDLRPCLGERERESDVAFEDVVYQEATRDYGDWDRGRRHW